MAGRNSVESSNYDRHQDCEQGPCPVYGMISRVVDTNQSFDDAGDDIAVDLVVRKHQSPLSS